MCCAGFIVKYVLFFANIVFALAGLVIIGLGVAVLYQIKDILDLIPVNINLLPTALIVLGCFIFVIAFLACCGAIRESRCMLILYAIFMAILAAIKIYLAVVLVRHLDNIRETVETWITTAFRQDNLRPAFFVMEDLFSCCGTTGGSSYVGVLPTIPPSCCAEPVNNTCTLQNSFQGCNDLVGTYFETFGDAIVGVIITVIIVELVALVFAGFLSHTIRNNRKQYA